MKLGSLLISMGVALGAFVLSQGCTLFDGSGNAKEDRLCTPGAYVFCRCADRAPGTKLCQDDGRSFSGCQTRGSGECVGGEIPDERTGEELEPEDRPDTKDGPKTINECPGKSLSPMPNVDLEIEGDTSTATDDRKGGGSCASGDGANDHVYHVIPTGTGKLQVKVTGEEGALAPVVYLRTTCEDVEGQKACGPTEPKATAQLSTNVRTGQDYYLFIDGSSSSSGKYTATLKLTPGTFCGDGEVKEGEACDDGNNEDNDGCSADCRSVNGSPPSGASCPGQPVHLWPNARVTGTGSTTAPNYGNAWNKPSQSCDPAGSNSYQDHIYAVTPHASGDLTVSLSAPAGGTLPNFMINARRSCETPEPSDALCVNDFGTSGSGLETLTFAVTKDKTVFVAIDGGGPSPPNKGDYVVTFELR